MAHEHCPSPQATSQSPPPHPPVPGCAPSKSSHGGGGGTCHKRPSHAPSDRRGPVDPQHRTPSDRGAHLLGPAGAGVAAPNGELCAPNPPPPPNGEAGADDAPKGEAGAAPNGDEEGPDPNAEGKGLC